MYRVLISSHAQRQVKKLPKEIQEYLISKIANLTHHPHLAHLKKLQGSVKNDWRLRVGNFRVLYEVLDTNQEILIYSIAARKDVYRGV